MICLHGSSFPNLTTHRDRSVTVRRTGYFGERKTRRFTNDDLLGAFGVVAFCSCAPMRTQKQCATIAPCKTFGEHIERCL